jgi:hypothetical protein
MRTAGILSIIATCIAHDVNPRAYLHRVVHCIVHGWRQAKLRELLPDQMLAAHSEFYVGDPDALPISSATRALAPLVPLPEPLADVTPVLSGVLEHTRHAVDPPLRSG